MLPGVGGSELIVLVLVALVVVGPKDLPVLMRKLAQWVGKARSLAGEFRSSFEEMARQSDLEDLRREVEALRRTATSDLSAPLDLHAELQPALHEVEAGASAETGAASPGLQVQLDQPLDLHGQDELAASQAEPTPDLEEAAETDEKSKPEPYTKVAYDFEPGMMH